MVIFNNKLLFDICGNASHIYKYNELDRHSSEPVCCKYENTNYLIKYVTFDVSGLDADGSNIDISASIPFIGYYHTIMKLFTSDGRLLHLPYINSRENILSMFVYRQIGQDIDGEASSDQSGYSVSLSLDGRRVAVGAHLNDGNGNASGHVRVYDLSGSIWVKIGEDIDGEASADQSGHSVSLSPDGRRVAVGAHLNDGNGNASGHVRVYDLSGSIWVKIGEDINGEAPGDWSGYSVSLSSDGSKVAVGARLNDGNGNDSGHVRVYEYQDSSWVQFGQDIDGEYQKNSSGHSVSLSYNGLRVAIGTHLNDNNGRNSGHVRVYEYQDAYWVQLGQSINGEAMDDYSGHSVSLSSDGSKVAIGGQGNNASGEDSGHVRVYEYQDSSWVQLGEDIDGEASNDQSGHSVSLSSDGGRVAIGARYNNGSGDKSGHVRVYGYEDDSWVQLDEDINGEFPGDRSGHSVSLSSDGSKVAIGANYHSGYSGHVKVYEYS